MIVHGVSTVNVIITIRIKHTRCAVVKKQNVLDIFIFYFYS